MKKMLSLLAATALVGAVSMVNAQTVIQDFEGGTDTTALPNNWPITFSGSTGGVANTAATFSAEQANGGTLSGKLAWDWANASGGVIRIQPAAGGVIAGTNDAVNRTSTGTNEPEIQIAVFGAASGDEFQIYMGSTNNGGSPYGAFEDVDVISWTGWQVVAKNVETDTMVPWAVTGQPDPAVAISWSGLFIRQLQAGPTTGDVLYLDDIQWAPATNVNDWSVY